MATRIPINKESFGFEDRQKKIWEEMESEMERRRREWEEEIDKMRKEFFMLRPEGGDEGRTMGGGGGAPVSPLGLGGERVVRSRLLDSSANDDSRGAVVKDELGNPVFKVLFDVQDYRPEEVTVKMDANKILVSARHEETGSGSSVSREYSRAVNLPHEVDPLTLQCTLGPDGILTVEAPLPVPKYSAITDSASPPARVASLSSSSSQPLQQSSTTTSTYQSSSSTYPTGPRGVSNPVADPVFKPASGSFQNSAKSLSPPLSSKQQAAPVSSAQPSSARDVSGAVPGYSKVSAPFRAYSPPPPAPSYSPPAHKAAAGARSGSPVVTADKDGKFRLEVDIEDFRPEELAVKTQDQRVVVCARRQEKSGNRTSSRELSREYTLPDSVDPLTIKAFFTDGGKLIVEAPLRDGIGQSVRLQMAGR